LITNVNFNFTRWSMFRMVRFRLNGAELSKKNHACDRSFSRLYRIKLGNMYSRRALASNDRLRRSRKQHEKLHVTGQHSNQAAQLNGGRHLCSGNRQTSLRTCTEPTSLLNNLNRNTSKQTFKDGLFRILGTFMRRMRSFWRRRCNDVWAAASSMLACEASGKPLQSPMALLHRAWCQLDHLPIPKAHRHSRKASPTEHPCQLGFWACRPRPYKCSG